MSKKLGLECKLYYDATPLAVGETAVDGSWTELTAAKDVTTNLEAGEADMTSRANSGWRATRAALRDGSLDFDLLWDSGDAGVGAIRAAFIGGNDIALAVMDGDIAVSGNEGFVANFGITAFNRSEPLEEGVTISVTAKPRDHQEWYEVAP